MPKKSNNGLCHPCEKLTNKPSGIGWPRGLAMELISIAKDRGRSFLAILFLLSVTVVALTATSCTCIQSPGTKLDAIKTSRVLRVGTTADFMPFSYRLEGSSELRGVDIAFSRKLASAMGVEARFVQTQWPNLMDDLLADKFDVALSGITITLARLRVAAFSQPLMTSGKVAIARAENVARYRTIEQINRPGVRVIVNPGGTNEAFARENFPRSSIFVNAENLTVFEKIVSGSADVMVTDSVEAAIQAAIHPSLAVANRDKPFNSFEFGILLPQDGVLKTYIDNWLQSQFEEDGYRKIFAAELAAIESRLSP